MSEQQKEIAFPSLEEYIAVDNSSLMDEQLSDSTVTSSESSDDTFSFPSLEEYISADNSELMLSDDVSDKVEGDPDSWSNTFYRAFNETQKAIAQTAIKEGKRFDLPSLEAWGKQDVKEQEEDIKIYGTPLRNQSPSIAIDEVIKIYEETGDIKPALERALLAAKDASAIAAGGSAMTLGTIGAGVATGIVSPIAGTITALVAPLLVAGATLSGPAYFRTKKLGGTEEQSQLAGDIVGGVGGLLERFGAGVAVNQLVKAVGVKAVVDGLAKEVGESAAKRVVKNAAEVVGRGTISAAAEAGTEASQAFLEDAVPGTIVDKGIFPYGTEEAKIKILDSAIIGGVGGLQLGSGSTILTQMVNRDLAIRQSELDQALDQAENANIDTETEISQLTNIVGNPKAMSSARLASSAFRTALSPLSNLFTRSPEGAKIGQAISGYVDNVNSAAPQLQEVQELFDNFRKTVRFPGSRTYSAKIDKELINYMENNIEPTISGIAELGNRLREILGEIETDPLTGKPLETIKIKESDIIDFLSSGTQQDTQLEMFEDTTSSVTLDPKIYDALNNNEIVQSKLQEINERIKQSPNESTTIISEVVRTSPELQQLKGTTVFKPKATGIFGKRVDAGIPIKYEPNYFPGKFKTGATARRNLKNVLVKDIGMSREDANNLVAKIETNDGSLPNSDIEINIERDTNLPLSESALASQKNRSFTPTERKILRDKNTLESNAESIIMKHILDSVKQINTKEMADIINENTNILIKDGNKDTGQYINPSEINRIKDIFQATQGRYKSMDDRGIESFQKWVLTHQYMATLPLVGLTALVEPLIILSRVSPRYALFGTIQALYNALRRGLRTTFPKLKRGQAEKAFESIMQGFDATFADRMGDISGVTVSRKVGNKFFRAVGLTTITQISRDMAFQATRMQMIADFKTINKYGTSKPKQRTREYLDAQARLKEQGIINPYAQSIQDWMLNPSSSKTDPEVIRKGLSKTVNDLIMAPNALNRPLWMSNPHLAFVAQLKGFMFTFFNAIVGRMYREIFRPLFQGRMPAGEIAKYAITFSLIVAASMYIQGWKDDIRYGKEESPTDKLTGFEQVAKGIKSTNILGPAGLVIDAGNSGKYGSNFWEVILGPAASQIANLGTAPFKSEKAMANELTNLVPFLSMLPAVNETRKKFRDSVEDLIEKAVD